MKNKAFTLAETIITLLIFISVTAIGTLNLKNYSDQLVFEKSFRNITDILEQQMRLAVVSYKPNTISYDSRKNEIVCLDTDDKISTYKLPKGFKVIVYEDDLKVGRTGYVKPCTWKVIGNGYERTFTIQMVFGKIYLQKRTRISSN